MMDQWGPKPVAAGVLKLYGDSYKLCALLVYIVVNES